MAPGQRCSSSGRGVVNRAPAAADPIWPREAADRYARDIRFGLSRDPCGEARVTILPPIARVRPILGPGNRAAGVRTSWTEKVRSGEEVTIFNSSGSPGEARDAPRAGRSFSLVPDNVPGHARRCRSVR